ncbi:uncharacterized protein LOC141883760 [Acropora palmata]|uniref:uncharacterized protein LOC141883760 n=1 Tax=Acropora palmata TaxID=6131 RepID=UPI003DA0D39A
MAPKRLLNTSSIEGTSIKKRKVVKTGGASPRTPSSPTASSETTSLADVPKRDKHGKLVFTDFPDFKPNMTPKEVLQAGSFGGTYFRPIYSSITGKKYSADVYKEFPADWFQGLNIKSQVTSAVYRSEVNTYKVKCGGSLEMWESSGWIHKQDPYGWFHWYCRFFLGRRTEDDSRQVDRWKKCAGDKGRWRNNLITKVVRSGCAYDNFGVSPVVRQTLQHWGYRLTKKDFDTYAKKVKVK